MRYKKLEDRMWVKAKSLMTVDERRAKVQLIVETVSNNFDIDVKVLLHSRYAKGDLVNARDICITLLYEVMDSYQFRS